MMHLPDVNFWIALTFDGHVHHDTAVAWFQSDEDRLCSFCRVTQMGFLRLCTYSKALGADALSMTRAWDVYDQLLLDPRVRMVTEPGGLELPWRRHTRRRTSSHQVWTDAYLASFAEAAGLEVVTFDRGFRALKGPKLTLLS